MFTGNSGRLDVLEPDTEQLTHELELAVFGPPPKNFFRTVSLRFSKALPGDERAGVHGPSWLAYPANALLYARRTGTVLVNDDRSLPVPSVRGADVKAKAKQLAPIDGLGERRLCAAKPAAALVQ